VVLQAKLRNAGFAKFPQAYQVVVRCVINHNLALNWEYETTSHARLAPQVKNEKSARFPPERDVL